MNNIRYATSGMDRVLNYPTRRAVLPILSPGRHRRLMAMRDISNGAYSVEPFIQSGVVFVHIPKNGGNSVTAAVFGGIGGGHATVRDYEYLLRDPALRSFTVISFVRNPWDRLVSAYNYLSTGGGGPEDAAWALATLSRYRNFGEFVEHGLSESKLYAHIHLFPQFHFLWLNGCLRVDFLGRFEQFQQDFESLCSQLGRRFTLGHANASARPRQDYRSWYSDAQAEKVAKLYHRDIALFGYRFD